MTVQELQNILQDEDRNMEVEFTYKTPGRFSDDSDDHYKKVREVSVNKSRNTLVLE